MRSLCQKCIFCFIYGLKTELHEKSWFRIISKENQRVLFVANFQLLFRLLLFDSRGLVFPMRPSFIGRFRIADNLLCEVPFCQFVCFFFCFVFVFFFQLKGYIHEQQSCKKVITWLSCEVQITKESKDYE